MPDYYFWHFCVAALIFALLLWTPIAIGRRFPWVVAGVVLLLTSEYFFLGPYSYVHINEEADVSLPLWIFQVRWHLGGTFAHAVGGGQDALAMLAGGGEKVNLNHVLLNLPLWLGYALHKILVTGSSIVGMILLSRRIYPSLSRENALAVSVLAATSLPPLHVLSFLQGIGIAAQPLAAYVIVARSDVKGGMAYWLPVLAFTAFYAAHSTPIHTFLPLLMVLSVCCLMAGCANFRRVVVAVGVIGLVLLVNWFEVMAAITSLARYSGIHGRFVVTLADIPALAVTNLTAALPGPYIALAGVSVLVLILTRSGATFRVGAALLIANLTGPFLSSAPQHLLGPLSGFDFTRLSAWSNNVVVPLAVAAALVGLARWNSPDRSRETTRETTWPNRIAAAAVWAAAMTQAIGLKVEEASYLLTEGSLHSFFGSPTLWDRSWWPQQELFRVVSVPERLRADIMLAYGLETTDSATNIAPTERRAFFEQVRRRAPHGDPSRTFVNDGQTAEIASPQERAVARCQGVMDIDAVVDVRLLGVANTGFIISRLPLNGGGLRLVRESKRPPRPCTLALTDKFRLGLAQIFEADDVYVYAVPSPLPRAFFAQGLHRVAANADDTAFYAAVAEWAPLRHAVVRGDGIAAPVNPKAEVLAVESVPNGYDIRIAADAGGLLVLNTPYVPFWSAWAGETPLTIFAVSGIHMGIEVPGGVTSVTLRYRRPQ